MSMIDPRYLSKEHSFPSVILSLIFLAILAGIVYLGTLFYWAKRYDNEFPRIEVGISKQTVLEKMGEPAEITDCHYFKYSGATESEAGKCAEIYWYHALLREYIVVFDKDRRVLTRWSIISG